MSVSHRITHLVGAGLIAGVLAAPAAHARPAGPDVPRSGRAAGIAPPPPVVRSVDDGFDWASAAIGAGTAGGLVLLLGVGGTTWRHRHPHVDTAP